MFYNFKERKYLAYSYFGFGLHEPIIIFLYYDNLVKLWVSKFCFVLSFCFLSSLGVWSIMAQLKTPGSGSRMPLLHTTGSISSQDGINLTCVFRQLSESSIYFWYHSSVTHIMFARPHRGRIPESRHAVIIRQMGPGRPLLAPHSRPQCPQRYVVASPATGPGSVFLVTKVPTSVDVMSTWREHNSLENWRSMDYRLKSLFSVNVRK